MRLFFDSSVLFAACYSKTGGARELIRRAIRGQVELCVSDYVFRETEATLTDRAPRALPAFNYLRGRDFWLIVNASREQVVAALDSVMDRFDAPIIAAAKASKADYLLSFDRKHLHTSAVEAFLGVRVVTPDVVMKMIRADE